MVKQEESQAIDKLKQEFQSNPNLEIGEFVESYPRDDTKKAVQNEFNILVKQERKRIDKLKEEFHFNPNLNIKKFIESCPEYTWKAVQGEFDVLRKRKRLETIDKLKKEFDTNKNFNIDIFIKFCPDYTKDRVQNEFNRLYVAKVKAYSDALNAGEYSTVFHILATVPDELAQELRNKWVVFVQQQLESVWPNIVKDKEKAQALASIDRNLVVTARAGSGKTTLLGLVVFFLIKEFKIPRHEIVTLAFNTDAADSLGKRINEDYFNEPVFENYANFHQLALSICSLSKENERVIKEEEIWKLLRDSFREVLNEDEQLASDIYEFFRREMDEFEGKNLHLPDDEYYELRRNQFDYSLGGWPVKSKGEKWIADFLWEHDIGFAYESPIWHKELKTYIYPDFEIYRRHRPQGEPKLLLEHWAVTEAGRNPLPEWFGKSSKQYIEESEKKKDFYAEVGYDLLETSSDECLGGRENFEKILKTRLEEYEINCSKLPQEMLIENIFKKQEAKILESLNNFISRVRSNFWSPDDLEAKLAKIPGDSRAYFFTKLACRVYKKYQQKKVERRVRLLDFGDFFPRAIDTLKNNSEQKISRWGSRNLTPFSLTQVKYLLIDEFQDFSPHFFELIRAIREANPKIRIIGVGDDWQAINQFAASSTKYIKQFGGFFTPHNKTHLLTNYRSATDIVNCSNQLMSGLGKKSIPFLTEGGRIKTWRVDRNDVVYIEGHDSKKDTEEYKNDLKYRYKSDDRFLKARYTKKMAEIISEVVCNKNYREQGASPSILILFRKNKFRGLSIPDIQDKIFSASKETFKTKDNFDQIVEFTTAHKSKGSEADCVIIVGANEGSFPLIHPDNSLNVVFGDGPDEIWEAERNLFYVAATRAKKELHFLTETGKESPFLKNYTSETSRPQASQFSQDGDKLWDDDIPF